MKLNVILNLIFESTIELQIQEKYLKTKACCIKSESEP